MSLERTVGYCLAYQELLEAIENDTIISPDGFEDRVQPSSFEPVVGDDVYVIYTDLGAIFRPNPERSVLRSLRELPSSQRQRMSIDESGVELKKGFSYLVHLEDKLKLPEELKVKSSPKSSLGRLFLNTRLMSDYESRWDELQDSCDKVRDLWLLVQPLAFNVILRSGISLNQLRFITSYNAILHHDELRAEWDKLVKKYGPVDALLYKRLSKRRTAPVDPTITNGLEIHLDLSGRNTHGVVALRARNNPAPIDLGKSKFYDYDDYFEPMTREHCPKSLENGLKVSPGEHYLLASDEVLKIPEHLNVELRPHDHIGFHGPLHFAGFIDNGFEGDLVFEIKSEEVSGIVLDHGMPISKLDVFRTKVPDKIYGKHTGSYQFQVGSKPSKHFKDIDYEDAAKQYSLLNEKVLVHEPQVLLRHHHSEDKFVFGDKVLLDDIVRDLKSGFFHFRHDCEDDEDVLQPIPYVLMFGPKDKDGNDTIFAYLRAKSIRDSGDKRLFNKRSIGLGGHLLEEDKPRYVDKGIIRKVDEEVKVRGDYSRPKFIGTLRAVNEHVDRFHFGLVYASMAYGRVSIVGSSLKEGSLIPVDELLSDPDRYQTYETWSKALFPYIKEVRSRCRFRRPR